MKHSDMMNEAAKLVAVLEKLQPVLNEAKPARSIAFTKEEQVLVRLANDREIAPGELPPALIPLLYGWYCAGYLM